MLGLSDTKRRTQELPFGRADVSTRFVTLVIVMMTLLATLALGGAQMILSLRGAWVADIRGQISVEIPAMNDAGFQRSLAEMDALSVQMARALDAFGDVQIMGREAIETLVHPWLGDASAQDDLPLPALLGLSVQDADMAAITAAVQGVDARAVVDTHQGWVQDLRRFAGVLLGASGFMALIVVLCAMLCVSGAVRAQLSAHKADIDLLHLMGASDAYIGSQFVRVVARDVGYAASFGLLGGIGLLLLGRMIAGSLPDMGFSGFGWNFWHWLSFISLPVVITILCFITARRTVLRELEKMP